MITWTVLRLTGKWRVLGVVKAENADLAYEAAREQFPEAYKSQWEAFKVERSAA